MSRIKYSVVNVVRTEFKKHSYAHKIMTILQLFILKCNFIFIFQISLQYNDYLVISSTFYQSNVTISFTLPVALILSLDYYLWLTNNEIYPVIKLHFKPAPKYPDPTVFLIHSLHCEVGCHQ